MDYSDRFFPGPHRAALTEKDIPPEQHEEMFREACDNALLSVPEARRIIKTIASQTRTLGEIGATELAAKLGAWLAQRTDGELKALGRKL